MKPVIIINCKTYAESSGEKGICFARAIATVKSAKYNVALAPPIVLLREVARKVRIPIFAQHVDCEDYGAHTGQILPAEVKEAGARGVILNHSEKKLKFEVLQKSVELCKKKGLEVIICASTPSEAKKASKLKPDYIAYEPSALIGGDVSVTNAKPHIIQEVVQVVKRINPKTTVLCGAGVHTREDVQKAVELGVAGVLLAHAIVTAKDPAAMLRRMMR